MSQATVTKKSYSTSFASKRNIVKSNQINDAAFKLSVIEYRLILLLISQLQEEDFEGGLKYHFHTKYIYKLFNMTKNKDAYARIRDAVTSLHTKTVKIKCGKVEIQHNWLISSYYSHENGNFVLELNPNLKPYLLDLKGHFTQYRLNNVLALPTMRSIRLYELLKQYVKIGNRKFESATLRLQLGLDADDYPKSYDFKTRILKPAIKEINSKTDIHVELIELKDGRNIRGYQFMIQHSTVASPPALTETRLLSEPLQMQLQDIGFSPRQVYRLSENYTESFLRRHLDATLARHSVTPYNNLYAHLQQRFREQFIKETTTTDKCTVLKVMSNMLTQSIAETKVEEAAAQHELSTQEDASVVIELEHDELPVAEQYMVDALNSEVSETTPIQKILPNYGGSYIPKPPNTAVVVNEGMYPSAKKTKALKDTTLSATTYHALIDLGVTKSQIKYLASTYGEARMLDNLNYTLERHRKNPLGLPSRYFVAAVEKNYHAEQEALKQSAKGLLRGDVISHLPHVPNPVEIPDEPIRSYELPIVETRSNENELNENALDVSNHGLDTETFTYLLRFRIEVGFMQSTEELNELMYEYIPKIDQSISNGVLLEDISRRESGLVEFYLKHKP